MSIKSQSFSKRLNAYFERYSTTTQILQALLKQEAAPQDFIGLACADWIRSPITQFPESFHKAKSSRGFWMNILGMEKF